MTSDAQVIAGLRLRKVLDEVRKLSGGVVDIAAGLAVEVERLEGAAGACTAPVTAAMSTVVAQPGNATRDRVHRALRVIARFADEPTLIEAWRLAVAQANPCDRPALEVFPRAVDELLAEFLSEARR